MASCPPSIGPKPVTEYGSLFTRCRADQSAAPGARVTCHRSPLVIDPV